MTVAPNHPPSKTAARGLGGWQRPAPPNDGATPSNDGWSLPPQMEGRTRSERPRTVPTLERTRSATRAMMPAKDEEWAEMMATAKKVHMVPAR